MKKINTLLRNAFMLMMAFVYSFGCKSQGQFVDRFNVLYLDLTHGLPSNYVDDIIADSDGFIWIATYGGGLARYDGYSILNFGVGSSRNKLKSNSCRNMCEDSFHRMWISFDEYTEVFDLKMLRPVIPHDKQKRLEDILKERSIHVCCDAKGKIWIATMQNIYCVSFHSNGDVDQILKYPYRVNTPDVFISDIDGDGSVWVAFGGSLRRLSKNNEQLVNSAIFSALPNLPVAYISNVVKYRNKYWIATNNGLYSYEPYGNKLSVYRHDYSSMSLSHDYVSSLAVTPDNQLIIGTLGGIDVPNMEMNNFEHIDVGNDMALSNNFVNCLNYIYGQLWVGTEGGGVIHFVPRQLHIQNYVHTNAPTSLSPFAVNALFMQDNGTLWVGTVEGGLNRKLQGETGFTHYTTDNTRLSHNSVSAITTDNRQQLWVGTWAGGINVCSLSSPSDIQPLPIEASYQSLLNFIGALQFDVVNDGIWIGSNDGIFFYDLKTGKIIDPFFGNRNFRGCIGSIILPEGQLWMGCLEGAVVVDLKKRTSKGFVYKHLKYLLDEPKSGIIDKIACFCRSADGTLWIGSNGYGLYKQVIDKQGKETFKAYRLEDGLANNTVKGIVEDQHGMLWVTTMHGLSIFNPKTEVFTNYHEEDGLLSSQFYWNSAISSTDGVLYFGSNKGLVCITGENNVDINKGKLHFTQLTVNNQVAEAGGKHIDSNISLAKRIKLKESDKSFTIEFSALYYGNETQGIYSYRLRGFEQQWTPLPSGQHSVRYTNLPSGDYLFEVKYASAHDDEQTEPISIAIHVTPYFWKSWWFITLLFLLAIYLAYRYYKRFQQRRLEQLALIKKEEAERLMRPIEKVLRESEDPVQLQQRIQNILDNQMCYHESSRKSVQADAEERRKNNKPFMDRVMKIMEQNYMNSEFGVNEFCQEIGMSRTLLAKKLYEHTGQSTNQFIRNYRLDIAKQIIKRGDQRNIAEIAFCVGFNDPKYFTRCFTKVYGVSPSNMIEQS